MNCKRVEGSFSLFAGALFIGLDDARLVAGLNVGLGGGVDVRGGRVLTHLALLAHLLVFTPVFLVPPVVSLIGMLTTSLEGPL